MSEKYTPKVREMLDEDNREKLDAIFHPEFKRITRPEQKSMIPETPEEIFGYLLEKPKSPDTATWQQLHGKRNWEGAMAEFISAFGISLENSDVFSCVMFDKAGEAPKTLDEVANTLQEGDDYVAGMIRHLKDGWNMLMFRPDEAIPYKVQFNIGGYPERAEELTLTEMPQEPKKPGVWKRFANWITRGSAYREEIEQYRSDVQQYESDMQLYREDEVHLAAVSKREKALDEERVERTIAAHAEAERQREEQYDYMNRVHARYMKLKEAEKDEISLDTLSDKQKPSVSRSTPTAEKKAPEKSGPKTGL